MSVADAVGLVAVGILVGAFSALFGVGGGVIMVPFIVLMLDETQHLAEGTSLLVIVPTAVIGVASHMKRGFVSFRLGALLASGGIVGSVVGAILALELSGDALQKIFAVFVGVVGVRLVYQGIAQTRGG